MNNIKFNLSTMRNYPANDWGNAQSIPQDYHKSHFFVVGLRIQNHFIKWNCNYGGCGKVYPDYSTALSWEVRNDERLPYCTCGHRVYLVADTGEKYK